MPAPLPSPLYSPRVDDALIFVADAFRHYPRKGSGVAYLSHLLQVAVWVMEHGGSEDQVVAALLHDYLEDIPGATPDLLEGRFGAPVRELVVALSDTTVAVGKPPWEERKRAYLTTLAAKPERVKLISACDKLHNARSTLLDLRSEGPTTWDKFRGGRDGCLWYFREVVVALGTGWEHVLVVRLEETVRAIHVEAGAPLG